MNWITDIIQSLPLYILSLPVIFMALSVHESAHGYVAYKLGDPTARSLGRLTLNPVKHIDPIGFICMMVFHVGWAKPVPINTRYFKKPRRDMALSGAAGPVSNLILSVIHLLILRIGMIFIAKAFDAELGQFYLSLFFEEEVFKGSLAFTAVSLVVYLLYLGVIMNISLAIFNLIPVPPFDGSRIFYAFLPTKLYFGVMKYERIILLVVLGLFFVVPPLCDMLGIGYFSPLNWLLDQILNGLFLASGFNGTTEMSAMNMMVIYVQNLLTLPL